MESVNYTYIDVTNKSTHIDEFEFWVIGLSGDKLCVCHSEESAELIVAALNGVAP